MLPSRVYVPEGTTIRDGLPEIQARADELWNVKNITLLGAVDVSGQNDPGSDVAKVIPATDRMMADECLVFTRIAQEIIHIDVPEESEVANAPIKQEPTTEDGSIEDSPISHVPEASPSKKREQANPDVKTPAAKKPTKTGLVESLARTHAPRKSVVLEDIDSAQGEESKGSQIVVDEATKDVLKVFESNWNPGIQQIMTIGLPLRNALRNESGCPITTF
jgi:hypothetical protein